MTSLACGTGQGQVAEGSRRKGEGGQDGHDGPHRESAGHGEQVGTSADGGQVREGVSLKNDFGMASSVLFGCLKSN
jgi:hypothetical protein